MPTLNNTFRQKKAPKINTGYRKDSHRLTSRQRGYDYRWEQARLNFLKNNPLCKDHLDRGETVAANVVDHIEPHRGDKVLFWDKSNWQPLCESCHNRKSASENTSGFGGSPKPKWLEKSKIPVTLVTGAPLSGKSTWVAQQATENDLIVDLDVIMSEMVGKPPHTFDKDPHLSEALHKRNTILGKLSNNNIAEKYNQCYFILGAPDLTTRRWWEEKLGCRIVVMDATVDECLDRLHNSERYGKKISEEVIKKHFMRYNRCMTDEFVRVDNAST